MSGQPAAWPATPDVMARLEALATESLRVIHAGQDAGGAFIAGPSFSQYRYAWLRDGAFIAEAMDAVGYVATASIFHDWVTRVVLGAREGVERSIAAARAGGVPVRSDYLHCRYRVDGVPADDDWPTFQLDGPGIWLWSLAHHVRHGGTLDERRRAAAALAGRYLAALWRVPCADAWEEHPERVHTSTLAAILAGLRALGELDPEAAASGDIRQAREALEERLVRGQGALTKWEGSDAVDASLLWPIVPYAILAISHPRAEATLARVEGDLVSPNGGVHRYLGDTYYGGGEWLLLTAALARVRLRRDAPGDRAAAGEALVWIADQAAPDGSLPEQVPTRALHPGHVDPWRARWGESARPLLWSHATYLTLARELGVRIVDRDEPRP